MGSRLKVVSRFLIITALVILFVALWKTALAVNSNFQQIKPGISVGNLASDPSGARKGDLYYNSTSNIFRFWNGTLWGNIAFNITGSGDTSNVAAPIALGSGITTGTGNFILSNQGSGSNLTTGSDNTMVGLSAGTTNITGSNNTGMGWRACAHVIGDENSCFGFLAGTLQNGGRRNTYIGGESGPQGGGSGDENTMVGMASGYNLTTGHNNAGLGKYSGITATTGSNNVSLGSDADVAAVGTSNAISIGQGTIAATNTIELGNSSHTNTNLYGVVNLASDLRPVSDAGTNLGSPTKAMNDIWTYEQETQSVVIHDSTLSLGAADIGLIFGNRNGADVSISGDAQTASGSARTIGVQLSSDNDAALDTKSIKLLTGNASGTTKNSGSLVFQTGTATGTRGKLQILDGSEGTAGGLWASTDTTGKGHWAGTSYKAGGVVYSTGSDFATLAAGTANQVLVSNGAGNPTWGTASATGVTSDYACSYFATGNSWARTSASLGDPTNSGGNTLTSVASNNITLTAASSTRLGVTFTPANSSSVYLVTVYLNMLGGGSTSIWTVAKVWDGTTLIGYGNTNYQTGGGFGFPMTIQGIYAPGTGSAVTITVQTASAANSITVQDQSALATPATFCLVRIK